MHISVLYNFSFKYTGGSHLGHTVVKPDSCLSQIFCQITDKLDRFSCSQKIQLKQDPPVAIIGLVMVRRINLCRGQLFSNVVKIMLFISDIQYYIPVKLCKTAGSITYI